jgi:galactose mutarotase-like enzyme
MATASETIRLCKGDVEAKVATRGAELVSWRVAGRELLWQCDAASWHEQSPVLFPVVGWTRNGEARVGGRTYKLALHGFARHRDFTLVEHEADHARFALADDEATRALYPFPFRLALDYRIAEGGLLASMIIDNPGEAAMPYSVGLHPGFCWPIGGLRPGEDLARAQAGHRVVFSDPVPAEVPVIAPGGLISSRKRNVPLQDRTLPLDPSLFSADALVFEDARSRSVVFANDRESLEFGFENLPTIVLWMRPGAAFLCIEGWQGLCDPEGFAGDLYEKPGMFLLPPGGTARHAMSFAARVQA